MQLLFRSAGILTIDGIRFILSVRTDGVTTEMEFSQNPVSYTAETSNPIEIVYGSAVKTVYIGSRTSGSLTFPYDGEAKQISLSGGTVVCGGVSMPSPAVFRWGTVFGAPDPAAAFSVTGPSYLTTVTVGCRVTAPEGYYPVLLDIYGERDYSDSWRLDADLVIEADGTQAKHRLESYYSDGRKLRYTCLAVYYATAEAAAARGSDYIGAAEYHSPVYTCCSGGGSYVPYDLAFTSPVRGGKTVVTWGTFTDMRGVFQLQRSADGGSWVTVYEGVSNRFTETAGDWNTVAYRVRSSWLNSTSVWVGGEAVPVGQSNVYVGIGGKPVPAAEIYLGRNGSVIPVPPMVTVGK